MLSGTPSLAHAGAFLPLSPKTRKIISLETSPPGREQAPPPHAASGMFSSLGSAGAIFHVGGRQDAYVTITCQEPLTYTRVLTTRGRDRHDRAAPGYPGGGVRRHPARNAGSSGGRELGGGVKALGEPPAGSGGRPSPQQGPGEAPKPQTATAAPAPVFAGRQAVLCPRRAIVNDSCARELSITLP